MIRTLTLAALGSALLAASAFAGPVSLTTTVLKESIARDAEGRVQTVTTAPEHISPGDHVVYRLTYKNGGEKPAADVVVTNPVPADLEYAGAGSGPAPLVSVDNETFAPIAELKVRHGDVEAPAAYADVTAVRWTLTDLVPAGGEAQMSFRAKLK